MQDGGAFAKAGEKYLAKNFSKGNNVPLKKEITVNRIMAASIDDDWQTEPIIPSGTPRPIKYKQKARSRFVMPYDDNIGYYHIPQRQSPEPESVKLVPTTRFVRPQQQPKKNEGETIEHVEMPKPENQNVKQQAHITSDVHVPPHQKIENLGLALFAIPGKDFIFEVKDEEKHIHKIVLAARSSYFYQQFFGNSGEAMTSINVAEFDKEVVELAIKACYGQTINVETLDYGIVGQLIKFATTYKIPCITKMLQNKLSKCIVEENVCSLTAYAVESDDRDLLQKCADFIADAIIGDKPTPPGIESLPPQFDKEIVRAIIAKNKK